MKVNKYRFIPALVIAGVSVIARYNIDGSLDNTFNGAGILVTDAGSAYGVSMAVQADGKILIAGTALERYNSNGSLDVSFHGYGKITSFQD